MIIEDLKVDIFEDEFGLEVDESSDLRVDDALVTGNVTQIDDDSYKVEISKIEACFRFGKEKSIHAFMDVKKLLSEAIKQDIREAMISQYIKESSEQDHALPHDWD